MRGDGHLEAWMFVGASLIAACGDGSKPGISEIDIGVDVRVNAIIAVPYRNLGLFAAVSGGTIVDQDGQRWQLSSHELRALAGDQDRYWVCGDRGYLAFADVDQSDTEPIWTPVDVGVDADLYGLVMGQSQVVVVGDETLRVGSEADGEWQWIEPPAPSGGWGRLRAITTVKDGSQYKLLAVGLRGQALLSSTDFTSFEVLEGLDPTVDFTSACGSLVLGEGLAYARWTGAGWVSGGGDGAADYLACGMGYVLSSDRWISKFTGSEPEQLYRLPWQGRAIDPLVGIYVAGDRGHVAFWTEGELHER